jgi:hypothetical protein
LLEAYLARGMHIDDFALKLDRESRFGHDHGKERKSA